MANSNEQTCRLCLEIIPPWECDAVEKVKDVLDVLLIHIDFNISDSAVACSICLERLQDCFEFKSNITNLMDADIKPIIKKELIDDKSIYRENLQVCGLCKSLMEEETFNYTTKWKNGVHLEDAIRNCLPEVNLNSVGEPLICKLCVSSLQSYYEFMKYCEEVEQRIKHYQMASHDTTGTVILKDMLRFKNGDVSRKPTSIKKECLEIECEEIDIKMESDNAVEMSDSHQSENYDNFGTDGFIETETSVKKSETKGKTYFCPECPYFSKWSNHITRHMLSHPDNEVHKCTLCGFVTDAESLMEAHMMTHKGLTKTYGCPDCPYESNHKDSLVNHFITHKDKLETEKYKDLLCIYKSKYQKAALRHQKLQHSPNVNIYKCEECSFSSKCEMSLMDHQLLRHNNPGDEILKHKCEKCEFKTKFKGSLTRHFLKHRDTEMEMYKCPLCPYESKSKQAMVRHGKMQHNPNMKIYKCKQCWFSTKHEKTLVDHQLKHNNPEKVLKHKCEECNFKTQYKRNLVLHMLVHEKPEVVNKLKCEICPYQAKRLSNLRSHMLSHSGECPSSVNEKSLLDHQVKHENPEAEIQKHKCEKCGFKTKYRSNLVKHFLKHTDMPETEMYKCSLCPYKSKYKQAIVRHEKQQHNPDMKIYKCKECWFVTKYEKSLLDHQLKHKNPEEEIAKHECEKYELDTKCEDPEVGNKFKCEICPYQTKRLRYLRRHMVGHSEKRPYSCDQCTYSTKIRGYLSVHKRLHQDNK